MVNTSFMRWGNPDTTTDLICLCCFRTIARSQDQADLLTAEGDHICSPFGDFVFPHLDALQDPHRQDQSTMSGEDCHAD
jgi:hypothetical protein